MFLFGFELVNFLEVVKKLFGRSGVFHGVFVGGFGHETAEWVG